MRCKQCESSLNALADGELSLFFAWGLRRHLRHCLACAQAYEEILRINAMAHAWRQATDASPLSLTLQNRIREATPAEPWIAPRKERSMFRPIISIAGATSLLAVAIGLGVQYFPASTTGIGQAGIALAQVEEAVANVHTAHVRMQIHLDTAENKDVELISSDSWLRTDPSSFVVSTNGTRIIGDRSGITQYIAGTKPISISKQPITRSMIQKEILFPEIVVGGKSLKAPLPNWGSGTQIRDASGRHLIRFVAKENTMHRMLLVDPQTRLPVRIVVDTNTQSDSEVAPVNTHIQVDFFFNQNPPPGTFSRSR